MRFDAAGRLRGRLRANASDPRGLGVDFERSSELDPVAFGERRLTRRAAAEHCNAEPRGIERVLDDEPRSVDSLPDGRTRRKLDLDDILDRRGRPDDGDLHRGFA